MGRGLTQMSYYMFLIHSDIDPMSSGGTLGNSGFLSKVKQTKSFFSSNQLLYFKCDTKAVLTYLHKSGSRLSEEAHERVGRLRFSPCRRL